MGQKHKPTHTEIHKHIQINQKPKPRHIKKRRNIQIRRHIQMGQTCKKDKPIHIQTV